MQAPFPREVIPFERDGNLMRVAIVALLPSQVPPAPADFGGTSGSLRVPNAERRRLKGELKNQANATHQLAGHPRRLFPWPDSLCGPMLGALQPNLIELARKAPGHASWRERCTPERCTPEGDFYSCPL
jgi:hypothetical protein